LVFGRSIKAANLPTFLQFGNAKKSDICLIFAKKIVAGHESKTGGGYASGPGLKPPLSDHF